MKKSSILLLCIGLQMKPSTIRTVRGQVEYGLMGSFYLSSSLYMIPALYFLFHIGKKWELPKKVLILSLLGGMFLSGWLSSFAIYYIHDLGGFFSPDSPF